MEEYTNNFDFEIIPNPVKNLFSIQSQDAIVNIQLFNSLGQFMGELPVADQYDLSRFPAGVYLVLVKTEKGVNVQKLIK